MAVGPCRPKASEVSTKLRGAPCTKVPSNLRPSQEPTRRNTISLVHSNGVLRRVKGHKAPRVVQPPGPSAAAPPSGASCSVSSARKRWGFWRRSSSKSKARGRRAAAPGYTSPVLSRAQYSVQGLNEYLRTARGARQASSEPEAFGLEGDLVQPGPTHSAPPSAAPARPDKDTQPHTPPHPLLHQPGQKRTPSLTLRPTLCCTSQARKGHPASHSAPPSAAPARPKRTPSLTLRPTLCCTSQARKGHPASHSAPFTAARTIPESEHVRRVVTASRYVERFDFHRPLPGSPLSPSPWALALLPVPSQLAASWHRQGIGDGRQRQASQQPSAPPRSFSRPRASTVLLQCRSSPCCRRRHWSAHPRILRAQLRCRARERSWSWTSSRRRREASACPWRWIPRRTGGSGCCCTGKDGVCCRAREARPECASFSRGLGGTLGPCEALPSLPRRPEVQLRHVPGVLLCSTCACAVCVRSNRERRAATLPLCLPS